MRTLNGYWQEIARTSQNVGGYDETLILYAYADENLSGNYSTVHTQLNIVINAPNGLSVSGWNASLDNESSSNGWTDWSQGEQALISCSWNVSHADDGTGSVDINAHFDATYGISSWDWSDTVGLQTIPRKSVVTISSANIVLDGKTSYAIDTNRKSSTFTHVLNTNASGSWEVIARNVGDTYAWVPDTKYYSALSNGTKTCSLSCDTYNGSTKIGTTSVTITLNSAGASVPALSNTSIILNGSNSVTIETKKKSTSFTHKIQQNISGTFVDISTNVVDSTSWTPVNDYYTIVGSTFKDVTIRCITYSGSTLVGQNDVTLRIKSIGADNLSLSSTNMTMNNPYTISITKNISDFRHVLTYSYVNASGKIPEDGSKVDTSVSWTPDVSLAYQIMDKLSANGLITCETFYGSTSIGKKSIAFTLNIFDYSVFIDLQKIVEEGTDGKSPANILTTYGIGNEEVVGLISVKHLTCTATTVFNAWITSMSVTFGGTTLDTSKNTDKGVFDGTFKSLLNGNLTITATDSRNKTSTITRSFTFRNYFKPTILQFVGDRESQTSPTGSLKSNGNFWNGTAGTTANTVTSAITGASSGSPTLTKSNNTWSAVFAISGADPAKTYDYTISVTDSFGFSASSTFELAISEPVLWKGKHTVRIHRFLIVDRIIKAAKGVFTESVTAPTFNGALNGNASTATTAANADTVDGFHFHWEGKNAQPYWVLGSTDGTYTYPHMYVYHPGDWSVNYANNAGEVNKNVTSIADSTVSVTSGSATAGGATEYKFGGFSLIAFSVTPSANAVSGTTIKIRFSGKNWVPWVGLGQVLWGKQIGNAIAISADTIQVTFEYAIAAKNTPPVYVLVINA